MFNLNLSVVVVVVVVVVAVCVTPHIGHASETEPKQEPTTKRPSEQELKAALKSLKKRRGDLRRSLLDEGLRKDLNVTVFKQLYADVEDIEEQMYQVQNQLGEVDLLSQYLNDNKQWSDISFRIYWSTNKMRALRHGFVQEVGKKRRSKKLLAILRDQILKYEEEIRDLEEQLNLVQYRLEREYKELRRQSGSNETTTSA